MLDSVNDKRSFSEWKLGVACAFVSAQSAFRALQALCAVGLNQTWIGFFRPARHGETVAVLDAEWEGDPRETPGIFPLREGRQRSLHEALRKRGVPAAEMQHLKRTIPPWGIVVIVDADQRSEEARAVLAECGGRLASPRR
jgi:hypothetical protein